MEILSGLLVVFLGVRLVWQRWTTFHSQRASYQDLSHIMVLSHNHILLVRSRTLVEGIGVFGSSWSSALPLISAVLVTLLGVGITLSGLTVYLRS